MLLESLLALSIIGQNPDISNVLQEPYHKIEQKQEEHQSEQRKQKVIVPIPVLCYHWIVPEGHKILESARRYAQTTNEFKATIKEYKKKGYEFITVTELYSIINSYGSDSAQINLEDTVKYVLITIDDGLKCVYNYAYPILLEEKVKATLFIVNGCTIDSVVKGNPYLSWKELREMYESGAIDVQSHSCDGHSLINGKPAIITRKESESNEDYILRLFSDFIKSKEEIENKIGNGHKVIAIAWPFGMSNPTARKIAKLLGFDITFGVNGEKLDMNKIKDYKFFPRIEVNTKLK